MIKYRIQFKLKDKTIHLWERFGWSMEECLALTKIAINNEYGDRWAGSIAICAPQGESGWYNF